MSNQFYNTPAGNKPLTFEENRKRLQAMTQGNPPATPAVEEPTTAPVIRSRLLDRHQAASGPTSSSPAVASAEAPVTVPAETPTEPPVAVEPAETSAPAEAAASPEVLETPETIDQPTDNTDAGDKLSAGEEEKIQQLQEEIQNTPEDQVDPEVDPGQETEIKGLDPSSAKFWHVIWKKYVQGATIIDPVKGGEDKAVLEIALPQDNEVEIPAAEQMYSGLIGVGKKAGNIFETVVGLLPQAEIFFKNPSHGISLEIVADHKDIRFWVVVPKDLQDFMERQIHGAYPDADISLAKTEDFVPEEGVVRVYELGLKGQVFYPIRVTEDLPVDPLSAITSALTKLAEGDRVILQYIIQPSDEVWRRAGQRFVNQAQAPPKDGKERKTPVDSKVIDAVSTKIAKPGFRMVLRIMVLSADPIQAEHTATNIVRSFDQFAIPKLGAFKEHRLKANLNVASEMIRRIFPAWGNFPVFNTIELATLYHFPNKNIQTPKIAWLRFRKSPPPPNLPTDGVYLGKSEFRGNEVKVFLKPNDRVRHMYIIGQTGTGKSEFLKSLAQQDIVNGRGLAFIDPHGDVVEELLQMVPKERAEDVIYFNPSDTERPLGLNILEAKTEEAKHLVVNSFIGLLYKLYDPGHSGIIGPQLERAVRNVMLTAMAEPGNSMIEVLKLLIDPKFAETKIHLVEDPLVKSFWVDQMAQTSEQTRSETLGYFVSKFDRFVTEKTMRNIIGQTKSAFDFRDVMDTQKILLINLSKGLIGEENSNFLGLILVPRLLAAAMSRQNMAKEDRKDFFLYVDEFQNFATPDFAQILSEARKYRLSLTVANQFIGQMQDEIKDAVFGNVGTMISFRVGVDDGEYLQKQFEPTFTANDMINQTIGNCAIRLLIDGQPSKPFSMREDWPAIQALPSNKRIGEVIKEISRLKYGRDRRIVESEIAARAGFE